MSKHTIEKLFLQFRDRQDLPALAKVYDRTAPQLLALARRLAGPGVQAEDLLQDTFLAAIERPDAWDSSRPLVPWLLGILAHRAHTARHKVGRTPDPDRLPDRTVATPDALTQASEFQANVSRAIAGLPPLLRDAVHGSLVDGKRPSQMAVDLGLEPGTMRQRLHRGLGLLRLQLQAGVLLLLGLLGLRSSAIAASRKQILQATARRYAPTTGPIAASSGIYNPAAIAAAAAIVVLGAGAIWFVTGQDDAVEAGLFNAGTHQEVGEELAQVNSRQRLVIPDSEKAGKASTMTNQGTQASPKTGTLLRISDPDGQPIAHLPVKVIPGQAMDFEPWETWTDGAGELKLLPSLSPVEIQLRNNIPHLQALRVEPAGAGALLEQTIATLQPGFDSYRVVVQSNGQWIQILDASTGEPLQGEVFVEFEPAYHLDSSNGETWSPLKKHAFSHSHRTIQDGWHQLFATESCSPDDRLIVWAKGYEVWKKDGPSVYFDPSVALNRIYLQPNLRVHKSLKLVDKLGDPYQGYVSLRDIRTKRLLVIETIRRGLVTDFPFFGNNLILAFGRQSIDPIELSSASLQGEGELTVEIPTVLGRVVVQNPPEESPRLYLQKENSPFPLETSEANGALTEFTGLTPGKYLIGPLAWVQSEYRRSRGKGFQWDFELEAGGTQLVQWNANWFGENPVKGTLLFPGSRGPFQPFVMPVYGNHAIGAYGGNPLSASVLDSKGSYTIDDGTQPNRLIVAVNTSCSRVQVIGTVQAGTETVLPMGSIRLISESDIPAGTIVAYYVRREGMKDFHADNWKLVAWPRGKSQLTLHNVPRTVTKIAVGTNPTGYRNDSLELPVHWSEGQTTEIEFNATPQKPRPTPTGLNATEMPSTGFFFEDK